MIVTLTDVTGDDDLALGAVTQATATIVSDELPPIEGSAKIEITPDGWEEVAQPFSDDVPRTYSWV